MTVRKMWSHKSRRRGDRPDGEEEQPQEVTVQSSTHGTPEPTEGLALEEGGDFNPKALPTVREAPSCSPQD